MAAVDRVFLYLVTDFKRICKEFRVVREEHRHLLLTLEVFLLGVAESLFVIQECIGRQTDESVVRRSVLFPHEVGIVCSDYLHSCLSGKFYYSFQGYFLPLIDFLGLSRNLCPVQLHFEIIIVSEDFLVPFHSFFCCSHVSVDYVSRDFSCDTCGAADQIFRIFLHYLVAYPRLVVHALDMACRDYLHQVLVAVVVLGQEDEMVIFLVVLVLELMVIVSGDIYFAAYDRLYRRMFLRELEEFLHTVHVAVVGDGKTWHTQFFGSVEKILD